MEIPDDIEFFCVDHFDQQLYEKALSWVKDHNRHAAFISDQEITSDHPRVKIYHLASPLQKEMIIKKIAWGAVLEKMYVIGNTYKEELERCHLAAHLILSDAAHYWKGPITHARKNRCVFRRGLELKNAFEKVPAIIVGAGPSLKKNGHLLKKLKDRALIFAGGTALNTIGVKPHFAAAIDERASHKLFKKHKYKQVPFFYQARMQPDNFRTMTGEKLLIPDSSSQAINWLYGEEETFNGGWTVGNFLTQIAITLGCSPIIFVGMDLAYEDGNKYAGEHAFDEAELIQVGEYQTQKDWLMSAMWTQEKAKEHEMINATEGGILGLKEIPLSEINLPKISVDVMSKIQKLPKYGMDRFGLWDNSIKNCGKNSEITDEEVVYRALLEPLWQIWKPVFSRAVEQDPSQDIDQHQKMFFQNVLAEYE